MVPVIVTDPVLSTGDRSRFVPSDELSEATYQQLSVLLGKSIEPDLVPETWGEAAYIRAANQRKFDPNLSLKIGIKLEDVKMMSNNQLSQAYEHYLLSNLALEAAEKMADVLYSADFIEEASALRAYVANGPNSTYTIQSGPWAGCDCIVSDIDPDFKAQGPLWFDLTELTHAFPLQLKPHYANDNWLSIHPVYVWQFKAFLRLVRWEEWNAPFPVDLFNPDRFEAVDETAFVTNIYSDEGNTHAFWLGKFLGYETCLREARKQISVEAFTAMFPAYLGLWQGMSKLPVQAETLREALFAETLDLDFQPSRRMAFVSSNLKNFPEPNILHDVWQKLDNVSFLTAIRPQTILKNSLENTRYLQRSGLPINDYAVALTSFAPRPSIGLYL